MSNKKNLLIYAHYYIPDTASTGQILRELAEGMLDKFNITIICVVPSYLGTIEDKYKTQKYYEEEINGVKVLRIRVPEFSKANKKSRVKNIVSYFFGAMGATFKVGKMDYVFSISQPPILGGLLGVWGKWVKHAKYIYNIQDFNPEQVLAVGYTKSKFVTDAMMWFDKLWQNTVDFFRTLDIPVRTLECCSGDLADLKVKSLDVEAWSPRQKKYFEVGSCSNLGDAQARRLKIRVKGEDGKKYLAHTLNNTVVAPPRMLIAFLENNLNEDGSVRIPEALRPYMGGQEVIR